MPSHSTAIRPLAVATMSLTVSLLFAGCGQSSEVGGEEVVGRYIKATHGDLAELRATSCYPKASTVSEVLGRARSPLRESPIEVIEIKSLKSDFSETRRYAVRGSSDGGEFLTNVAVYPGASGWCVGGEEQK